MELYYPMFQGGYYLIFDNVAVGPLGGNPQSYYDTIPFSGSLGYLEEGPGIYGEHGVTHEKLAGNFMYQPIFANWLPGPSSTYPRAGSLLTVAGNRSCVAGVFMNYGTSVTSTTWNPVHYAFTFSPPNCWTISRIHFAGTTKGSRISAVFEFQIVSDGYVPSRWAMTGIITYRYTNTALWLDHDLEPNRLQSYDTLIGLVQNVKRVMWANDGKFVQYLKGDIGTGHVPKNPEKYDSIDTCQSKISAMMYMMIPETFPIPQMHRGDLVMKAVEKKRPITSNMIGFLRDLKDIPNLIPKLAALKTVKGIAGQYLSVKYGVLPTISDLNQIWKALRPHIRGKDANGFEDFKASHSASLVKDGISFTLEQHVKVAIDEEDNEMDKLWEKLDNVGLLPSLENIWDLVGYSFVIDWFVDVGDMLKRVDTGLRILRYNIRYLTHSYKMTASGTANSSVSYPFSGTFSWVKYHRWVSLIAPLPPISLTLPSNPISHWLEGGALLVQRIKK